MRSFARSWWLAACLLVACDRGIEANEDNLSHFASVASELRRDARELDLLAKKVEAVQTRLERRKSEIAEHVFSDELSSQREGLLARLAQREPDAAAPEPDAAPEPEPEPDLAALSGVLALHEQMIGPLDIGDDTLHGDNDYWWWLEELGLQSADSSNLGDDFDESGEVANEAERAVEDCRTHYDDESRARACANLLDNHLTKTHFELLKKQRQSELDLQIARLDLIEKQFAAEATDRRASAAKVMAAYGSSFDGLIIWGFPALIVAVLIIVLFEGRRRRAGEPGSTTDTLAVVTVMLLVSAIIILGLGGKIQPEALGTLIGGISGYVLGKGAQLLGGEAKPAAAGVEAKPAAPEPAPAVPPMPSPAASEAKPAPTPTPAPTPSGEAKPAVAPEPASEPEPEPSESPSAWPRRRVDPEP